MADELMDINEVRAEVRLSATTIRTLRREKLFPEPIKLGKRKIAWRRSDVNEWKMKGSE